MKSLLLLLFLPTLTHAQYAIHCGTLIDGTGAAPRKEVTLVLEGGKIASIIPGYAGNTSQPVLDAKSKTVMPGLIDCHVHLEHEHSAQDLEHSVSYEPADYAFDATVFARRTLLAGFTTVRDLGGTGVNISLRKAIASGKVVGPRILTAGIAIGSTGGHMDESNGLCDALVPLRPGPQQGIGDGPAELAKAVRANFRRGVDVIKIASTGGVLSSNKDGTRPHLTQEELNAIVSVAKDYGLPVACHAHGAEGIKRALRAGVTSIEHGSIQDEECVALFKKTGAWYVPTLTAGRSVSDSAKKPGYFSPMITAKALEVGPRMAASFSRAYKAGVKIAYGTDAGVYKHGLNYLEAQYMHEAGMAPMDILVSATRNAADLCGILSTVGTLEVGKIADIIILPGNPLDNIAALGKVESVLQGGIIVKP